MKKVSTAVAKQGRNISRQKLTIGLDLGESATWKDSLLLTSGRSGAPGLRPFIVCCSGVIADRREIGVRLVFYQGQVFG